MLLMLGTTALFAAENNNQKNEKVECARTVALQSLKTLNVVEESL